MEQQEQAQPPVSPEAQQLRVARDAMRLLRAAMNGSAMIGHPN